MLQQTADLIKKGMEKRKSKQIRKEIVDFNINDKTRLESGKPVDFSFMQYKTLSAVGIEGARLSRIGGYPSSSKTQKFLTKAVWLNNNKLNSIANMNELIECILAEPAELGWIDFSYNYINTIDDVILKYTKLKIIYFHGNLINDLDEIIKLKELKELRSATFKGNPICDKPCYRSYIVTILPQIVNLDFSPILKSERMMPKPPEALRKLSELFDDTVSKQDGGPQEEYEGDEVVLQKIDPT